MKSIISSRNDKELFKDSFSKEEHSKNLKNNDFDEDMVVISRDGFDNSFNSYDWIINKDFDDNSKNSSNEYNDKYDNYRQLSRYEDILKLINDDKLHSNNLINFEMNNDAFYNSMKDQIIDETLRIMDTDYANQRENFEDYDDLDVQYKTFVKDTDKIIKIVSDKDKSFLNLIHSQEKHEDEWDYQANKIKNNELRKENSAQNDEYDLKHKTSNNDKNINDDDIFFLKDKNEKKEITNYDKPKIDKIVNNEVHETYELPKINGIDNDNPNVVSSPNSSQEPPLVKNNNLELPKNNSSTNEVFNTFEPTNNFVSNENNDLKNNLNRDNDTFKNPYIYESEIRKADLDTNLKPEIKENKPTIEDLEKERKLKLQEEINSLEKPVYNEEIVKPKTYSSYNFDLPKTTNESYDSDILPPSSNVENTEYNKLKKMIQYYNDNSDILTLGSSSPIGVSDSLKVNLYKDFYLDSAELFEGKREQNEKIDNILKEYENAISDNENYEAKKKLANFKKNLEENKIDNIKVKEKINELSNLNNKNVMIRNENTALKNKIKDLEYKMRQNIIYQKSILEEKEDVKKSLLENKAKNLGAKESIINQFTNSIEPNNLPKISKVESSSNDILEDNKPNNTKSLNNEIKSIDGDLNKFSDKNPVNLANQDGESKDINDIIAKKDEIIKNIPSKNNLDFQKYNNNLVSDNEQINKPMVSKQKDSSNILMNANNTLTNLKNQTSNDYDTKDVSLDDATSKSNKPFSFKEVNSLSPSSQNNQVPPSKRILESNITTPLDEAYHQKKQELFKSFNVDQPIPTKNNPQSFNNVKESSKPLTNSQKIISNKINDNDEIKIMSLKDALAKKR